MNKEIEHIDVSQEAKLIMDRIDRYEKQKRSTVHMIKPLTAIAAVAVLFLLPFFQIPFFGSSQSTGAPVARVFAMSIIR